MINGYTIQGKIFGGTKGTTTVHVQLQVHFSAAQSLVEVGHT